MASSNIELLKDSEQALLTLERHASILETNPTLLQQLCRVQAILRRNEQIIKELETSNVESGSDGVSFEQRGSETGKMALLIKELNDNLTQVVRCYQVLPPPTTSRSAT